MRAIIEANRLGVLGVRSAGDVRGLCIIDDDVSEELALAVIESITVLGALQIRPASERGANRKS